MIDLDEVERQYAPFKEVPVCFVEYPQVNKLCAAVPLLIAELRAARKVVEAARNMIGDKSIELKTALRKYDEVVK